MRVCDVMLKRDAGWQRDVAKSILIAAWMLHGLRFGRKPGTKPCVFLRMVPAAGNERYLVCAAVAGRSF